MSNNFLSTITAQNLYRNLNVAALYKHAIHPNENSVISDKGALIVYSGLKTGRSPKDKKILFENSSSDNIWWGDVNIKMDESEYDANFNNAIEYFNKQENIYVFDGFVGWDADNKLKVRIICTRPYHALFMHNMLIRPTEEELINFGEPDYTIYNAGAYQASMDHFKTYINLSFDRKQFLILGTEYAGEMKKGIFTIMNYLMPLKGILSMHCSANEGSDKDDVSLFFGLSGTGKTTLSADAQRKLIGDDEHCWSDTGIFNIEGGCYAKVINLSEKQEPEIYNAIKFGTILENVKYNSTSNRVDYTDVSITENTRASYPIDYISNAKIPCTSSHPKNIIFLTCDAFGVLPPVSKLTTAQAMYHFISGYTAKIAGTEQGIVEPTATFSACFGAAFMVWHPSKYAELLSSRIMDNETNVWLINTGWIGGAYGKGSRIKLKYTRAIVDAIHDGSLEQANFIHDTVFGFAIPDYCENVPSEILNPANSWEDKNEYEIKLKQLASLFISNFKKFEDGADKDVVNAGPKV